MFHQDLRLDDNTALIEATRASDAIVPCVIATSASGLRHGDGGRHAAAFTFDALVDLGQQLEARGSALHVYRGEPGDTVTRLIGELEIDAVFFNRGYTPSSLEWEGQVERACTSLGVDVSAWDDRLLHAPGAVVKDDGDPYRVFTAYHRRAAQTPVREPRPLPKGVLLKIAGTDPVESLRSVWSLTDRGDGQPTGGRSRALGIIDTIGSFERYRDERDIPAIARTTSLSPYLRSGCCSAREVLRAIRDGLGNQHQLARQLHWRDFFTHIAFHYPHVFDGPFHRRYEALTWNDDPALLDAWRQGRTGFPIVDAGMRELEASGNMHNQVRMIVSSFLVKDLHIDWRNGERHFADLLVDYDPAVNNGNWQWAASTGCDAQPYFRVFNPWLQQKKFDPDAAYIKRWIPELARVKSAEIRNLWKTPATGAYPEPIVDHRRESQEARSRYQSV